MNDITGLIERLEKASGPNLALEWEIHLTAFGIEGAGMYGKHPNYTYSIDAALTLVPEHDGKRWHVILMPSYRRGHQDSRPAALIAPPWSSRSDNYEGQSVAPAIALCIAALKARAAVLAKQDDTLKSRQRSTSTPTQE